MIVSGNLLFASVVGLALAAAAFPASAAPAAGPVKNVVLVHGGFVDGSGWAGVHRIPAAPRQRGGLGP
jgi:hypothetical protein